jgi:glycosyltransferase involved in cell wall biosynthesis
VIAGPTRPRVLAREGERYRESLITLAEVRFAPRYLDAVSLRRLLSRAEGVVLPYDPHDRTSSAVLTEAVASRTPVVAAGIAARNLGWASVADRYCRLAAGLTRRRAAGSWPAGTPRR